MEKIISPAVITKETDASFLPAAISEIGPALIGVFSKGKAFVPTEINDWAEFERLFGGFDGIKTLSGSNTIEDVKFYSAFLAFNYLKNASTLNVIRILGDNYSPAETPNIIDKNGNILFKIETLSHGDYANKEIKISITNIRKTSENIALGINSCSFTILVRKINDSDKYPEILESFNVNFDKEHPNFILRVIGDQLSKYNNSLNKVVVEGEYPNKSNYIRISYFNDSLNYNDDNIYPIGFEELYKFSSDITEFNEENYLNYFSTDYSGKNYAGFKFNSENINLVCVKGIDGVVTNSKWPNFDLLSPDNVNNFINSIESNLSLYKFSIPFQKGFDGEQLNFNNNNTIKNAYQKAFGIISDPDNIDINMVFIPGLTSIKNTELITKAIELCENRADCFLVFDCSEKNTNIDDAIESVKAFDTNYAATYYPWIKVVNPKDGKLVWTPPSVVMAGVIAFSDKISAEWYAPAGLNRGGISPAIQTYIKLNRDERDKLYLNRINPIASFPGEGIVAWGQKTLQKKPSALDRINVRRLLLKVEKFIASVSRYLIFEQNTSATRNKFLSIVEPYLQKVKERQGLYDFKVILDELNTPDIIDRNMLVGKIILQPSKAIEYIVIDFTVSATGATFGA